MLTVQIRLSAVTTAQAIRPATPYFETIACAILATTVAVRSVSITT